MNSPKESFEVRIATWDKEVKGLFDYSATVGLKRDPRFNISNHCKVYRDNTHGENYFNTIAKVSQYFNFVCQLDLQQNGQDQGFWLRSPAKGNEVILERDSPYLVLPRNSQKNGHFLGHHLKVGDVIKFGNMQYTVIVEKTNNEIQTLQNQMADLFSRIIKVDRLQEKKPEKEAKMESSKQKKAIQAKDSTKAPKNKKIAKQLKKKAKAIKSDAQNQRSQNLMDIEEESKSIYQPIENEDEMNLHPSKQQNKIEQANCRICLFTQQEAEDPLITPCLCRGSCQFVHLECIKNWVGLKTKIETIGGVNNYFFSMTACQICRHPLPNFYKVSGKLIPLFKFDIPQNAYLILQSSNPQDANKQEKNYVVVDGVRNRITKIGRSSESDLIIKDTSVSREHAEIEFKDSRFYVRDNYSKFGTLLKIQNDLKFENEAVQVQVGRCLYQFRPMQRPKNYKKTAKNGSRK